MSFAETHTTSKVTAGRKVQTLFATLCFRPQFCCSMFALSGLGIVKSTPACGPRKSALRDQAFTTVPQHATMARPAIVVRDS